MITHTFEAPHWHQPTSCATAHPGDECENLQTCDVCDVLVCPDHQDEEQLAECCGIRGLFHHADCTLGCDHCVEALRDSYYSDLAESRREDALMAGEGRWTA